MDQNIRLFLLAGMAAFFSGPKFTPLSWKCQTTIFPKTSDHINSRLHTSSEPQKVGFFKGNLLLSGKSRVVKYDIFIVFIYILARKHVFSRVQSTLDC